MDRRAVFFGIAALVCLALVPVAQENFRAVTVGVAITYVVLAIASALDHRSKNR